MLLYFRDRFSGKPAFSKGELSQILGVYSKHLIQGEWRDYAIDSLPDMAVFSIYKSSKEGPLYAIAKIPGRSLLKPPQYAVFSGSKTLKQSPSLSEVLEIFEQQEKA